MVLAPEEGAAAWLSGTAVAAPARGALLQQVGDKFLQGGSETSTVPGAGVQMGKLVHNGELRGSRGADMKLLEKTPERKKEGEGEKTETKRKSSSLKVIHLSTGQHSQ